MRWIAALATLLVATGCPSSSTESCSGGWSCAGGLACAQAPVYCAAADRVSACAGKGAFDACQLTGGGAGTCYGGACTPCSNDLEGCVQAGWVAMTDPATEPLEAVWAPARGDAYAAGDASTLLHYDGATWTRDPAFPDLGASVKLVAVSGTGDDNVLVVTDAGSPAALRFDGTHWTDVTGDLPVGNLALWAADPAHVFAVGLDGMWLYDGTTWTQLSSGGSTVFTSVWGRSASDVYAVGVDSPGGVVTGAVWHYDGVQWTQLDLGSAAPGAKLTGVSGDASDVYVVGKYAGTTNTVLRYDGTTWTAESVPGTQLDFAGVWDTGDGTVFAVAGSGGNGKLAERQNGTWSEIAGPSTDSLAAVAGSGPADGFAVGAGGAIWHYTGM